MDFAKIILLLFLSQNIASVIYAQVPQGIPYQAVARNGQGQPLASTNVKVRFSILDSTATGTAVYVESHSTTTSALGLFTANVGMGAASTGTFSSINWGQNYKFLKVELDTTATGNSYIDLGTQQMMSVPYALYAGKALNSYNDTLSRLKIGDYYQGGIVFYFLQPNDLGFTSQYLHGLIVSPTDLGYATWGCNNTTLNNCNSFDIGSGYQNSLAILNQCYDSLIAASLCINYIHDGFDDWFLPSSGELEKLFLNGYVIGLNMNTWYWSSTQTYGPSGSWQPYYANMKCSCPYGYSEKFSLLNVRAIRSF
jgi:hypothetical protein